jgi:hypothetical protein
MSYCAIIRILICLTLSSVALCQSKPQIEAAYPHVAYTFNPPIPSNLKEVQISLASKGCFGDCPMYSLNISGSGIVTYIGKRFVSILGVHQAHISQDTLRRLVAEFYSVNYFRLAAQYGDCGQDDNTIEFSIEWPGVSKHVTECGAGYMSFGSLGNANPIETKIVPFPQLSELKSVIDDAVNSQLWVGMNLNQRITPTITINPFTSFNSFTTTRRINYEAISSGYN